MKKFALLSLVAIIMAGCGGSTSYSKNGEEAASQASGAANGAMDEAKNIEKTVNIYIPNITINPPADKEETASVAYTPYAQDDEDGELGKQIKGWWKINGLSKYVKKLRVTGHDLAYVLHGKIVQKGSSVVLDRNKKTDKADFDFIVHSTKDDKGLDKIYAIYRDGSQKEVHYK